jgi:hypothetical protein
MSADQADAPRPSKRGKPSGTGCLGRLVMGVAIAVMLAVSALAVLRTLAGFSSAKFSMPSPPANGILAENQTGTKLYVEWISPIDGKPIEFNWHHPPWLILRPGEFAIMPMRRLVGDRRTIAIRYRADWKSPWRTFSYAINPQNRAEHCDLRLLIKVMDVTVERFCRPSS